MQIILNTKIASDYKSPRQKTRVINEHWVETQAYYPSYGGRMKKYKNNFNYYCLGPNLQ